MPDLRGPIEACVPEVDDGCREGGLRRLAVEDHSDFTEIRLSFTRAMAQRHKDFRLTMLPSSHCILHDRMPIGSKPF